MASLHCKATKVPAQQSVSKNEGDSAAPGTEGVVMGHRLPRARLTGRGWLFIALVFGVPVVGGGLLLDGLLQWALGRCLGVWCWF